MRLTRILSAFLFFGTGAVAQGGDVAHGRILADEYCTRCHDVTPEGAAKTYPPSFASIAAFRPDDQITWRIWSPPMHAPMPQMITILTRQDVEDVTAYILSLSPTE